jgi:hypothetical protein
MAAEPPLFEPSDRTIERRRRRRATRRSTGLALAYVVLVAIVLIAAFSCPGDKGAVVETTTTTGEESGTTISTASISDTSATSPLTYTAELTGDQEIPAVSTLASGTLTFVVADDGSSVAYTLTVRNIDGVAIANLHQGKAGENGDTILKLYDGPKSGVFSGTLAEGTFTASDLVGPLKGGTIEQLVTMILADDVYLNVGTDTNHSGEIRGQLQ